MEKRKYFISHTNRTENDKAWAKWLEWAVRTGLGAETAMQEIEPFHIASAYAYMNMSVRLNIQPQGLFASSGWIAGRARLLENLRGWFA
jgi:hypothetical protein